METSALTFAQPAWFLALILVAAFGGLYFWSQKRNDSLIAKIVSPRLKSQLAGAVSIGRRAFKAALILSALALIIVALARPQSGFIEREVKQKGRDVIVAVDTSRSMLATDVSPTRLARAKLLAQDLMHLIRGDRVGLIAFAGSSFLQAPLTLDQGAVLGSLEELDTTIIPKGGTNIAAAIRQAQEAFGKGEGKTRALVILTDGEELDADGIAAAKAAAAEGVRIFTVGIGSGEGSLIPIRGEGGGNDFVRDEAGKPVQSRLDESRLKEISAAGGGFYEKLGPDTARDIFEKGILPLEETESGSMTSRQPIEQYHWPLGAATVLIALWSLLGEKRRTLARAPIAAAAAIFLLAGLPALQAADGLKDYESGNYQKALEDFNKGLEKTPESDKLQYNAGAAAYKMGDFGKAVDHFTKALLTEDKRLHEDASYNLANSLTRRGEAAQGNDAKKSDWKNAIQHYTEALNIDPKNKNATENRDIVKKLLADLEKQEKEQQDKKDQQKDDKKDDKKDDQKQDQKDQKDQQKQDKNDQSQDQKDQQNKDQQDQKPNDQKDQDQKDQKDQSGKGGDQKDDQKKQDEQKKDDQQAGDKKDEQKDQQQPQKDQQKDAGDQQKQQQADNKQGDKSQPTPQPTPGEKKEGDLKSGNDEKKDEPGQQGEQQTAAGGGEEEKDGQMSAAQARALLNSLRGEEERVKLMSTPETENTLKDW